MSERSDLGTCGAILSDDRKGKYLTVWCFIQVLWRRREARPGLEPPGAGLHCILGMQSVCGAGQSKEL